jgi:hydrogenase/urease accessory protein HupE
MKLRFVALLALFVALLWQPHDTAAHKIFPATATVSFDGDGGYRIDVKTNVEALIAGIGATHEDTDQSPEADRYKSLRALSTEELAARFTAFSTRWLKGVTVRFDGKRVSPRVAVLEVPSVGDTGRARISVIRLGGNVPGGATSFAWHYDETFGSSILRLKHAATDEMTTAWLKDGKPSDSIPLAGMIPKTVFETATDYIVLGFTHILPFGLDHILFVLGLYLLSTRMRPLLVQITAFTVAHTVTLALGLYGVVTISPSIVEPLIALSIVYVAVENILTPKLTLWRPFVVFGFGLLHGLGFAGVLQEIGLPRDDFLTALIAFNVGVEFGQLATIALAWLVTGLWFRDRPWYRVRIVYPSSGAIAVIGAYWTVERVFFT